MDIKEITWSLATQYKNGIYQGTFRFDLIQAALDHMSEYFAINFKRITRGGKILVLQSSKANKNPNVAAWTIGSTIYISPTYNFRKSAILTAKVILHEIGHIGNGTHHSRDPEALMSNNSGTSGGWVQDDLKWFGKYKLRKSMPPRSSIYNTFAKMDGVPIRKMYNPESGVSLQCEFYNSWFSRAVNYYDRIVAKYDDWRW